MSAMAAGDLDQMVGTLRRRDATSTTSTSPRTWRGSALYSPLRGAAARAAGDAVQPAPSTSSSARRASSGRSPASTSVSPCPTSTSPDDRPARRQFGRRPLDRARHRRERRRPSGVGSFTFVPLAKVDAAAATNYASEQNEANLDAYRVRSAPTRSPTGRAVRGRRAAVPRLLQRAPLRRRVVARSDRRQLLRAWWASTAPRRRRCRKATSAPDERRRGSWATALPAQIGQRRTR